jgi:hypothetical protein
MRVVGARLALALAIVAIPVACGGDDPSSPTGTVRGTVLAGPTCPVEQPGQDCAPTPVSGRVDLVRDGVTLASATIAADGTFSLDAPAGEATLVVNAGDGPFPSCPETRVKVITDEVVVVDIACDTGIR